MNRIKSTEKVFSFKLMVLDMKVLSRQGLSCSRDTAFYYYSVSSRLDFTVTGVDNYYDNYAIFKLMIASGDFKDGMADGTGKEHGQFLGFIEKSSYFRVNCNSIYAPIDYFTLGVQTFPDGARYEGSFKVCTYLLSMRIICI